MSNDIPVSTIKQQTLTDTPVTGDATLVDDAVALVDDSAALVGGPNTIIEGVKASVKPNQLFTKLPRSS